MLFIYGAGVVMYRDVQQAGLSVFGIGRLTTYVLGSGMLSPGRLCRVVVQPRCSDGFEQGRQQGTWGQSAYDLLSVGLEIHRGDRRLTWLLRQVTVSESN